MIRKLKSGEYRLYSKRIKTKRKVRNVQTREAAKHEREVNILKALRTCRANSAAAFSKLAISMATTALKSPPLEYFQLVVG
jgi:hypothetical protein